MEVNKMKLSKAQAKVMEKAKRDIDRARSMDYPEWLMDTHDYYRVPKWATDETSPYYNPRLVEHYRKKFDEAVAKEEWKDYWERERNGVVLTRCNSKTLKKLEEYGLIKIIYDSNGESLGIDTVQILNY